MYYEQGNLDMAILHYNSAISCDAGFLEAYNNLVGNLISFAYLYPSGNWVMYFKDLHPLKLKFLFSFIREMH